MIDLYNVATNRLLGSITPADLQVLVDALEEESAEDQDYYIDAATIDVIADGRASEHLVGLLRAALGLCVSNSLSGRHGELDQVPAVGNPTHVVELGSGHRVSASEG
jgi:hypothetical protein